MQNQTQETCRANKGSYELIERWSETENTQTTQRKSCNQLQPQQWNTLRTLSNSQLPANHH